MRGHRALVAFALIALPLSLGRRHERASPSQPVAFSHRVHAGENQIGCLMCHSYAEHSPTAGMPSMARCMGCHKFVARDKPDVKLLVQTNQKGDVLQWNRVYRLQDFVFFTHERHIAAGLQCRTCHGDVETMDVMRPVTALKMGWCVDCHRQRGAPSDCLTCHK